MCPRRRAVLTVFLLSLASSLARGGSVVYSNDFEKEVGKEWSDDRTGVTPQDNRRFLGQHMTDTVSLKLEKLPKHAYLRVSLELFIIQTWDGNVETSKSGPGVIGPDVWRMVMAANADANRPALTLVDATFSNYEAGADAGTPEGRPQSYPSILRGESNNAKTGAAERNTLGYEWGRAGVGRGMDSVYKLSFLIPHDAAQVQFDFMGAEGLNPADDECWGLDNVKVEALEAADVPAMDAAELRRLWEAVGGRDPVAETEAFWRLFAAGDAAAKMLRERVKPAGLERKAFWAAVKQLDGDAFEDRERATAAIKAMGTSAEGLIKLAIAAGPSAEAKQRLEAVLKQMSAAPPADPEERRRLIALRLLRAIGTPEAAKVAGELTGK